MTDLPYIVIAMVVGVAIPSVLVPLPKTRPMTRSQTAAYLAAAPAGGSFAGALTGHVARGFAFGLLLGLIGLIVPRVIYAGRRRYARRRSIA